MEKEKKANINRKKGRAQKKKKGNRRININGTNTNAFGMVATWLSSTAFCNGKKYFPSVFTESLVKYNSKTAGVLFKPRTYASLNSLWKPYP